MTRFTRYTTRHATLFFVISIALILTACGGGGEDNGGNGDAPPQLIETVVEDTPVPPTHTPHLPPTWTPVPTDTPVPPTPTIDLTPPSATPTPEPTETPIQPSATPDSTEGEGPPEVTPEPTVESGGTSPEPSRFDLAPVTAANADQIVQIAEYTAIEANKLAWQPGGQLAAAMSDGVWLLANGDFNADPIVLPDSGTAFGFQVECVAFSPDGTRIVSGNTAGELVVWDLTTNERVFTIQAHEAPFWDVVYSPDQTQIVTASRFGGFKVWNATTGELVREVATGEDTILDLAVYPTSGLVVATGVNTTQAQVWNLLGAGTRLATITGHSPEARAVAFSPDGETLASGGGEGSVRLWTVAGAQAGQPLAILANHTGKISVIAYSPDSQMMAVGVSDGMLVIWNLATNVKVFETQAHSSWLGSLVWTPDGTALLTAGEDRAVRLWGIPVGE